MIRIQQVKCRPGHSQEELLHKIAAVLRLKPEQILHYEIRKQSVDARKKPDIYYSYVVDVRTAQEEKLVKRLRDSGICLVNEQPYVFPAHRRNGRQPAEEERPVIIGTGPAGLFCGYLLAKHGFRPILLERGADVDTRVRDVERFWETGELNPESNVQFGEGGAGTFSDGKLNTLVKDKDGRNREALRIFAEHGAPERILYENKPHIGTDILVQVVKNMRHSIEEAGGEVRFGWKVTGLKQEHGRLAGLEINGRKTVRCRRAVLAVGHSARDTFHMLLEAGLTMEAKSFAAGYRVEHSQRLINRAQYAMEEPAKLPPASYKLTAQTSGGRGVYSFCMCPGGYVVNASSEAGRLAVNGMSYSDRGGRHANSAVIVSVTPEDYKALLRSEGYMDCPEALSGIMFQRILEERAYRAGQGRIPVQYLKDFKRKEWSPQENHPEERNLQRQVIRETDTETAGAEISGAEISGTEISGADISGAETFRMDTPCMKGAYRYADVRSILPEELNLAFLEAMERFGHTIPGFDAPDVLISGVESRTSSPVRILRNERLESSLAGLYPCGEGAGYAGGILSAAMDGMRMAERIAQESAGGNDGEDRAETAGRSGRAGT